MTRVLEVRDLHAGYGGVEVLRGVTVEVRAGELVALVGPNGAGKSTLLKAVYAQAQVTAGTVTYRDEAGDHDVTGWAPHRLTRRGLGYVPQLDNVFPTLTVEENLQVGATTRRHELREVIAEVLSVFPLLDERRRQRAGTLSGGQRQSLALARALMSRPRLLLLDEPTAGLAPRAIDHMFAMLDRIRALDISMLLVEQNARQALARADRGYVLEGGRDAHHGTGHELLSDPRVVDLYLGTELAAPGGTAVHPPTPPPEAS